MMVSPTKLNLKVKVLDVYDKNGDMFPLTKKRNNNPIWIVRELTKLMPSEILRYICLICILTNSVKWRKNHKRNCKFSFDKIGGKVNILHVNDKLLNGNETWNISVFQKGEYKDVPYFNRRKVCDKLFYQYYNTNLNLDEIDGLITADLSPKSVKSFDISKYRELTFCDNKKKKKYHTGMYLFGKKCRCFECDIIRCAAIEFDRHYIGVEKDILKYKGLHHDYDEPMWSFYPKPVYGFAFN